MINKAGIQWALAFGCMLLSLFGSVRAQTAKEVLDQSKEKLLALRTAFLDIRYIKEEDEITQSSLLLKRVDGDTIGAHFKLLTDHGVDGYYSGDWFNYVNTQLNVCQDFDMPRNLENMRKSIVAEQAIHEYTVAEPFKELYANLAALKLKPNVNINGKKCFVVEYPFAGTYEGEQRKMLSWVAIDAATMFPIKKVVDLLGKQVVHAHEWNFFITQNNQAVAEDAFLLVNAPKNFRRTPFSVENVSRRLNVGSVAPEWLVINEENKNVTLQEFKGKLIVLGFWYVASDRNARSLKILQKTQEVFADRNVQTFAVNVAVRNAAKARELVKEKNIDVQQLVTSGEMAQRYGVNSFPTFVVIDTDGKILQYVEATNENAATQLSTLIETHLKSKGM